MRNTKKRYKNREDSAIKHEGDKALLGAIITRFGGPKVLNKKIQPHIKLHYQSFVNWRTRGHVPLKYVVHIATLLNVSPYALNYLGYCKMTNVRIPWAKVVKEVSILDSQIRNHILSLKAPSNDSK